MSIIINTDKFNKDMLRLVQKQMPFAASKALNDTADDAKRALQAQMKKKLDRPTKFTLNAPGIKRASKRRLRAVVFIKDIQAEYLRYQIEGGTRSPKDKLLPIPGNIRLNKYGNIPGLRGGKKIAALLAKPNTFMGTVRGRTGIWQRMNKNKKLKLLIALEDKATYRKRFDFHKIVHSVIKSRIGRNLSRNLKSAIETAT